MNIEEIRKNAPKHANAYLKKPFMKVRYLHKHDGISWFLNKNGVPTDMCYEWSFWIKPL